MSELLLPDPPPGYRWKIRDCNHDRWSNYGWIGLDLRLQTKNIFGFWYSKRNGCVKQINGKSRAYCIEKIAEEMLSDHKAEEKANSEKRSLIGIYEQGTN